MRGNMDSGEREQINKIDKVKVSDIVEYLKVGKLSSHKYQDNVTTEYDKTNVFNISDKKDYVERDDIHKDIMYH